MQDSTRTHRARFVDNMNEMETSQRIKWPAYSRIKSDSVCLDHTRTAHLSKYDHIRICRRAIRPYFLFIDDISRPHRIDGILDTLECETN